MSREEAIRALRAHERELRAAGVISASLFGSTARGESAPGDVDIAVRLSRKPARRLLGVLIGVDPCLSVAKNWRPPSNSG